MEQAPADKVSEQTKELEITEKRNRGEAARKVKQGAIPVDFQFCSGRHHGDTTRFNPVGQSAPGLPRHDAPLPGHVPGQYNPIGGSDDFGSAGGGFNVYRGQGLGSGIWSTRVIMAFATYLTLPMQLVLYPIAAMPAFGAGYFIFHTRLATGVGFDASMSSAWTCAWLVLLPAMRVETGIESQVPGYRTVRHLFRVLAFAGWFYYFDVHEQMEPPQQAAIIALIVAADPFYPPIPIGERPMGRVPDDIVAA